MSSSAHLLLQQPLAVIALDCACFRNRQRCQPCTLQVRTPAVRWFADGLCFCLPLLVAQTTNQHLSLRPFSVFASSFALDFVLGFNLRFAPSNTQSQIAAVSPMRYYLSQTRKRGEGAAQLSATSSCWTLQPADFGDEAMLYLTGAGVKRNRR